MRRTGIHRGDLTEHRLGTLTVGCRCHPPLVVADIYWQALHWPESANQE